MSILEGQTVGNYQVLSRLGGGGMGAVYLAEHQLIGKKVALKVIHPHLSRNHEVLSRFFNEARAVSQIGHEHIIEIHDFGQTPQGDQFFIMEYLQGQTLADVLTAQATVEVDRVRHIAIQIAAALGAAHACDIIHRDLKPDNIMLISRGGDPDFVKVLDFGLAKMLASGGKALTAQGVVLGTPQYMSPEACEGRRDIDGRSDIYSLGILVFQMLTGQVPFNGTMSEVLIKHVAHPPPAPRAINPEVPPGVDQVVLRCLAKKPDQRFASMAELAQALADPDRYLASSPPIVASAPAAPDARTVFGGAAASAVPAAVPSAAPASAAPPPAPAPATAPSGAPPAAPPTRQGNAATGDAVGAAAAAGADPRFGPTDVELASNRKLALPAPPPSFADARAAADRIEARTVMGKVQSGSGLPPAAAGAVAASSADAKTAYFGPVSLSGSGSTAPPLPQPTNRTMVIPTPPGYSNRPKRRRTVVALIGVVVGGACALGAAYLAGAFGSGDQTHTARAGGGAALRADAGAGAAQAAAPPDAGPALARIDITTTPPGAAVLDERGKRLGTTPTVIELPRDGQAHKLTFQRAGDQAHTQTIKVTGNMRISVELSPLAPDAGQANARHRGRSHSRHHAHRQATAAATHHRAASAHHHASRRRKRKRAAHSGKVNNGVIAPKF